VVKRIFYCT